MALLMTNFTWGMGGNFVFSLNPADGHVVLTIQERIDEHTTGHTLLSMLHECAAQARSGWEEICEKLPSINTSALMQGMRG